MAPVTQTAPTTSAAVPSETTAVVPGINAGVNWMSYQPSPDEPYVLVRMSPLTTVNYADMATLVNWGLSAAGIKVRGARPGDDSSSIAIYPEDRGALNDIATLVPLLTEVHAKPVSATSPVGPGMSIPAEMEVCGPSKFVTTQSEGAILATCSSGAVTELFQLQPDASINVGEATYDPSSPDELNFNSIDEGLIGALTECFDKAPNCPDGQIAFVIGNYVAVAPVILTLPQNHQLPINLGDPSTVSSSAEALASAITLQLTGSKMRVELAVGMDTSDDQGQTTVSPGSTEKAIGANELGYIDCQAGDVMALDLAKTTTRLVTHAAGHVCATTVDTLVNGTHVSQSGRYIVSVGNYENQLPGSLGRSFEVFDLQTGQSAGYGKDEWADLDRRLAGTGLDASVPDVGVIGFDSRGDGTIHFRDQRFNGTATYAESVPELVSSLNPAEVPTGQADACFDSERLNPSGTNCPENMSHHLGVCGNVKQFWPQCDALIWPHLAA